MPQITVYLRNDDLPKWKSIPNKAEFLHNALVGVTPTLDKTHNSSVQSFLDSENKIAHMTKQTNSSAPLEEIPECCINEAKCKHWKWDGLNMYWFNPNTGDINEAIE